MRTHLIFVLALFSIVWTSGCKSSKQTVSTQTSSTSSRSVDSGDTDPATRQRIARDYIEATTQMVRGDYPAAMELFEQVISADPTNHAAMFNLARLSVEQRKYDQALEYGQRAIEQDPNNYWYYQVVQQAYEFKGDYPKAILTLEKISNSFPQRLQDRLRLVELYVQGEQLNKAISQLDEIENQIGPNPRIYSKKFQLYKQEGDFEKALEITKKLILMNPEQAGYYQMQYEVYQALNQNESAIKTLEKLLEVDPDNGYALLSLADYYKSIDQFDKSDTYLFRAFQNPDIEPEGKISIVEGLLNYVSKEPEILPRVQRLATLIMQTHPGTPRSYAIQGRILHLSGVVDSARYYYRLSLEEDPSNTQAWLDLIELSFNERDFRQMNKDAEEALEFYPNQEKFLFFFGISSSILEEYSGAVYALEKIKKINSSNSSLLAQACTELGKVYYRQNKPEKSEENFQRALELSPEDDYTLDAYGWVLYQKGDLQAANKIFEKAVSLSPSTLTLEHYGDVLLQLGQKDKAVSQWNKAIEKGATNLKIEEKLQGQ